MWIFDYIYQEHYIAITKLKDSHFHEQTKNLSCCR